MACPVQPATTMFGSLFSQLAQFGQPRSRAQIIQHHNDSAEDITSFLATVKHQYHSSNNRLVKPAESCGRPPAFNSCSPILCRDLQLDAVHKDHVLCGKLVVDALLMSSVYTVLEDEAGDVVQVFLYNTPQLRRCTPATGPADISAAQRVFPKGQRIAILEPYYKVMADGTRGVRVDNPAEVVFVDESGCPVERVPESHIGAGSKSSSSSGALGFSSADEQCSALHSSWLAAGSTNKPNKSKRPNKKKGKGGRK